MYKLIRNIGFAVVSLGLGMASCDEDYPKSHIEPYDTELLSIKNTFPLRPLPPSHAHLIPPTPQPTTSQKYH